MAVVVEAVWGVNRELGVEKIAAARLILIMACDCRVAALVLLLRSRGKLDVAQGVSFQAGGFLACIELEKELNDSLKVVGPEKLIRVAVA